MFAENRIARGVLSGFLVEGQRYIAVFAMDRVVAARTKDKAAVPAAVQ